MIQNTTIGSDVEFFVRDKRTGEIVSAEGFIMGSKHEPYHFVQSNEFYAVQLDNVLAEGNIPPAYTEGEFFHSLAFLREYMDSILPDHLETVAIPAARLDLKYLQTENAKVFGCDPSFCCWDGKVDAPQPVEGDNLRSAGFHIHIGYTAPQTETNIQLAQFMDLGLGVPSVLLEEPNDRKKVGYGKAGNFRHQRHGVEYRTLSSFFASSERLITWAFRGAHWAVKMVNEGYSISPTLGETIRGTVNSEDRKEAQALVKRLGVPMPA